MTARRGPLVLAAALLVAGCSDDQGHEVETDTAVTVTVSSPAFADGDEIPQRFTCDGDAVSPPLTWSGEQEEAWALVVDDPDAPGGTYVHWVVLDIPARTTSVETGAVPDGGVQVANTSDEASYAGPCPPSGEHRTGSPCTASTPRPGSPRAPAWTTLSTRSASTPRPAGR